ncbi:MAG: hypothetical protein GX878_09140, partial [Firmicutes bacterium]|nr:hypothetical protein [Bacillota bacterium]
MNILLVYTKTLSVERLKALLKNDHPDYEVAACSGLDVLKVTSEFKPHIAIIETGSHAPDSPAIMRYLKKQNCSVYLIAIAGAADEAAVQDALAAGAVDLIFGTPSDNELLYRIGKAAVPAAAKARPVPLRRPAKRKAAGRSRSKPPQKGGRAGKVLGNITFGILLTMMALLALFLIQSKITGEAPSVFGYRIYVVLSGSMNPAFDTGSAVFV